jgi:predicted enzyme related to lactoylglutathione lyase
MNQPILGLRTAIYQVADIDAAKAFYTRLFNQQPYFDQPFYVGFNIGGYELGLQPEDNPTTNKPESVTAYWGVEDIHAAFNRFVEAGATAFESPQDVGGDIIVAKVKDPWGNIIGLIYNPHFVVGK